MLQTPSLFLFLDAKCLCLVCVCVSLFNHYRNSLKTLKSMPWKSTNTPLGKPPRHPWFSCCYPPCPHSSHSSRGKHMYGPCQATVRRRINNYRYGNSLSRSILPLVQSVSNERGCAKCDCVWSLIHPSNTRFGFVFAHSEAAAKYAKMHTSQVREDVLFLDTAELLPACWCLSFFHLLNAQLQR